MNLVIKNSEIVWAKCSPKDQYYPAKVRKSFVIFHYIYIFLFDCQIVYSVLYRLFY